MSKDIRNTPVLDLLARRYATRGRRVKSQFEGDPFLDETAENDIDIDSEVSIEDASMEETIESIVDENISEEAEATPEEVVEEIVETIADVVDATGVDTEDIVDIISDIAAEPGALAELVEAVEDELEETSPPDEGEIDDDFIDEPDVDLDVEEEYEPDVTARRRRRSSRRTKRMARRTSPVNKVSRMKSVAESMFMESIPKIK